MAKEPTIEPLPIVSDTARYWKQGPLPVDTYNWGGVVKVGDDPKMGFYFADFNGSYAILCPSGEKVTADKVAWFCNDLVMPPGAAMGAKRLT